MLLMMFLLCFVKTTVGGEGFKFMVDHLLIGKDYVTQLQKLIESLHYILTKKEINCWNVLVKNM
jgi:hypothetical protein